MAASHMQDCFNWIHLSDAHFGMPGHSQKWPAIKSALLSDLSAMMGRTGGVHAVVFTGDIAFSGKEEEYMKAEKELFEPLWAKFKEMQCDPVLIAVPGNHDAKRPQSKNGSLTPAEKFLCNPDLFVHVEQEFWSGQESDYRQVCERAFAGYSNWYDRSPYSCRNRVKGRFPGDIGISIASGGRRIGFLGLNTALIHLCDVKQGQLVLSAEQVLALCGGECAEWAAGHDVCMLLTHHAPSWLTASSQKVYREDVAVSGRFMIHMFGHDHQDLNTHLSVGGAPPRRFWQCASIYADESGERRHGYSMGQLVFSKDTCRIRHFPRIGLRTDAGWKFAPDHRSAVDEHGAVNEEAIALKSPAAHKEGPQGAAQGSERLYPRLMAVYRKTLLRLVDIVDLANLPDDRHIAARNLLLRSLYIPLRVWVESDYADGRSGGVELLAEGGAMGPGTEIGERNVKQGKRSAVKHLFASTADGNASPRPTRAVILGDPGAGKSTLLRWLCTLWLSSQDQGVDPAVLPDFESLPNIQTVPVLIRCRQLDESLVGSCTLEDLIRQTLRQMELKLTAPEVDALGRSLLQHVDDGSATVLIDGLDEVADPLKRARFCARIENIAESYDKANFVVTSRIVGYRDMARKVSRGFVHARLTDLTPSDKDGFVQKWYGLVEPDPVRRRRESARLLASIHDESKRVERLTSNPMLLTTMALVQRKVGNLPLRKHKLYSEAVSVMLNWRSDVDEPLDPDEGMPQLEYLAWIMCQKGVQRLRRDEVLEALEKSRVELSHIQAIKRHSAEEFLKLVESRTSLVTEIGLAMHNGLEVPIYEFRHLSFQEYLAAVAVVRGHYPDYQRSQGLPERIAPMLSRYIESAKSDSGESEPDVVRGSWREVIRLCVQVCNDSDADGLLMHIVKQSEGSRAQPGIVMAGQCLVDEPNVGEETVRSVCLAIGNGASPEDGAGGAANTTLDSVVMALRAGPWGEILHDSLLESAESGSGSSNTLGLCVMIADVGEGAFPKKMLRMPVACQAASELVSSLEVSLRKGSNMQRIDSAVRVLSAFFRYGHALVATEELVDALLSNIGRSPSLDLATCWAFWWITGGHEASDDWVPNESQRARLVSMLPGHGRRSAGSMQVVEYEATCYLALAGGNLMMREFAELILWVLESGPHKSPAIAARMLSKIAGDRYIEQLCSMLPLSQNGTRVAIVEALGDIGSHAAASAVRAVQDDGDEALMYAKARALGRMRCPVAIDEWNAMSKKAKSKSYWVAMAGLVAAEVPEAVNRMRDFLAEKPCARRGALETLQRLGRDCPRTLFDHVLSARSAQGGMSVSGVLDRIVAESDFISLGQMLGNSDPEVRMVALKLLVRAPSLLRSDRRLVTADLDGVIPYMDPALAISAARVAEVSELSGWPEEVVWERYRHVGLVAGITSWT